jgi:hypothetical protein
MLTVYRGYICMCKSKKDGTQEQYSQSHNRSLIKTIQDITSVYLTVHARHDIIMLRP